MYQPHNLKLANGTNILVHDVITQLTEFQAYNVNKTVDPSTATAFIFVGTNDLDGLLVSQGYPKNNSFLSTMPNITIVQNEATCVINQVKGLYGMGFRDIIVINAMSVDSTFGISQQR